MINSPMRLDLATEWRSRRWRRLLNIIDRLPRDSAFCEALAEDETLAVQALKRQTGQSTAARPKRRMTDWSPTVELLTSIFDRLGELTQTVAALGGAKPRRIPHAPRPVTALERVRNRARTEAHQSLVARLLPGRGQPPPGKAPGVQQ